VVFWVFQLTLGWQWCKDGFMGCPIFHFAWTLICLPMEQAHVRGNRSSLGKCIRSAFELAL